MAGASELFNRDARLQTHPLCMTSHRAAHFQLMHLTECIICIKTAINTFIPLFLLRKALALI